MGSTTIPGGGGNADHGFHVFGDGSRQGGPSFQGFGQRSFGNFGQDADHRHVGNSFGMNGSHGFTGRGNGQTHAERFGAHQSALGHDTISMGSGHDTLVDAGRAAGAHYGYHVSHSATMAGGAHHTTFIGGAHTLSAHVGMTSVAGGSSHQSTHFADHKVGTDVIRNFVTGHDKLQLEGKALSYLHSHVDVTVGHGQTLLSLDGGHTTVALKGFSHSTDSGHKG
jgi:hypothetical protein